MAVEAASALRTTGGCNHDQHPTQLQSSSWPAGLPLGLDHLHDSRNHKDNINNFGAPAQTGHLDCKDADAEPDGSSIGGMGGSACGTADAEVALQMPGVGSIYELLSNRRRKTILAVISLAMLLVPLSDTIYLPVLQDVGKDLHTTDVVTSASVSIYLFLVGISSLFWGPLSDRFGRKAAYILSTILFIGSSFGCLFAPNIECLMVFRAAQGAALGAYKGAAYGTIADIYPPRERGLAIGLLTVPTLTGPLLGPIVGGFLAESYGWRGTFATLLVFSGGILLPLLAFGVPETHQYMQLDKLGKQDPAAAALIKEAGEISRHPPRFSAPWLPLQLLLERPIILHCLVGLLGFASFFTAITELPAQLSAAPYSLRPGLIGLAYLPAGLAGLIAAPCGGRLFDWAARLHPVNDPLVRLTVNNLLSMVCMPAGLLLYAWTVHARAHLAWLFVGLFLIGAAMSIYFPGMMGYVTILKQSKASSAIAGTNVLTSCAAGALILAGSAAVRAVGMGVFFTIVAGVHFACALAAGLQVWRRRRHGRDTLTDATLPKPTQPC